MKKKNDDVIDDSEIINAHQEFGKKVIDNVKEIVDEILDEEEING